jgi:ferric-dicitrate binding protein FerR (iron transport regulator)
MNPTPSSRSGNAAPDLDWDLLDRYWAGLSDAEESARAASMLERHPHAGAMMQRFLGTLDPAADGPTSLEQSELARRLAQHLAASKASARAIPAPPRRWRAVRWSAAAIVACVMLVAGGALVTRSRTAESRVERTYATHRGEQRTISLPDGSSIVLGPQSTLRHDAKFGAASRDVYLEGEAYFIVTHRGDAPFVVHAAKSATRVLGTEFFVKAYPAESVAKVAVTEGKVSFRANAAGQGSGVLLVRGQIATVDARGDVTVVRNAPVDAYRAWMHGQLVFKKAKLRDVIDDLERRYDITIVLDDPALADATVNVTLDTESMDRAMAVIADIVGATWSETGRVVTFASRAHSR